VGYLSRFLCAAFTLALLATGCAAPRPLKGGRAVTTRKPAGIVEQTLVQGENPAQATKQSQETVKVRTYTVPAGSRMEQSQTPAAAPAQLSTINSGPLSTINSDPINSPPSTLNPQPSTSFLLSAPMPVVEREESRAGTELGAAQKDTARELGAKLASLKGIVWVGVGLFVFGLASLVYPPLKVVVASVTTSAALMLGGVALMVLPSLIVGNELLILGGVAIAVGAWFLAHHQGHLRGLVAASSGPQSTAPPPAPRTPVPSHVSRIAHHASRTTLHVSVIMSTNLNPQIPSPRSLTGEGVATAVGIMGSALLIARKFLTPKAAKPEPMSRADFYAELVVLKDHIHAGHLAILEKLDVNLRELLAALERKATRINALESGLARMDERTRS